MNEISQLLISRRTVHKYNSKKVPEDLILNALETALWAPNHKMTNPTRFNLISSEKRMELVNLKLKIRAEKGQEVDKLQVSDKYLTPSHLLIISQIIAKDPVTIKEDYASLSCVVHNISLLLWYHGIGSKWSTGDIIKRPELFEILELDPKLESIEGLIWMGYPAKIRPPIQRPKLDEVLRIH